MLEELVRKYALQNAILHAGKANEKAVIGKILAAEPELRSNIKEVMQEVESAVARVNKLSLAEQRKELESEAPELLEKKTRTKQVGADALIRDGASGSGRIQIFRELPNVRGDVVMRFAPGPSGPLHIGHTRAAILNDEYVKRYGGTYIIRLEDTNPAKIDPEAYESIKEDLRWLGVDYHKFLLQSDRFEIYYDLARKLIELRSAYICTCDVEEWRQAKLQKKPCPHRELEPESQLELWDKMLGGGFAEKEASYVVKTDLEHPNPAVRDFVGFRIVTTPHPKTRERYSVYPLYNFSVAVDDYLMGMTHVLRGKDHLNNTHRQEYIFHHFGWKKPTYIHYGLVQIVDSILKTSVISEGIRSGDYSGWDDVRLATLKALAKRGIEPDAIRRYWNEVGIKDVDIKFSWDNLYAFNKDIVDDGANRYFFVSDPMIIRVKGIDRLEGHAPYHPDHPEKGTRRIILEGRDGIKLHITKEDLSKIHSGDKIRLKDLCNVKFISTKEAEFIGNDIALLKDGIKIIHWVSEDNVPTRLFMPDGSSKDGFSEHIQTEDHGRIVQFERTGFVRVEKKHNEYAAYFAHR